LDNIELKFEDEVLDLIVDTALELKLGARGLRSICETIMTDLMFELPTKKGTEKTEYTITKDYAEKKLQKLKSIKHLTKKAI